MSFLVRIRLRKNARLFSQAETLPESLVRALAFAQLGFGTAHDWLEDNITEVLDAKEEADND